MKNNELILIGGGGHCKSCIDVILAGNDFSIKGILDIPSRLGGSILGYPIIGSDSEIAEFAKKGYSFLVTLGHTGNVSLRNKIFQRLTEQGANTPAIISSHAMVSSSAKIGKGSIVMHKAIVNSSSVIGANCIINSNALLEHDSSLGDNSHVSTGALINGDCSIGANCFIGSGAVLRNGISVTSDVIIGMGSVVTSSILHKGTYVGNPAKAINK